MRKAQLTASATITIDNSEFSKTKNWSVDDLRNIIQEITLLKFQEKSVSGIKMTIQIVAPTDLEILKAISVAK